eukprot:11621612-Ditylum_brightwellii.AAC.1
MNNDYSATVSQASCYRVVESGQSQASRDNMMSPTKRNTKDFHESTSMNLLFVLDKWTELVGKSRISIQLQVPSGSDYASKLDIR